MLTNRPEYIHAVFLYTPSSTLTLQIGLPDFVKEEVDAFLEGGILAHGDLAPVLRRLRP